MGKEKLAKLAQSVHILAVKLSSQDFWKSEI